MEKETPDFAFLTEFEEVLTDPAAEVFLRKIKDVEDILNEIPVTNTEISELVAGLDHEWPYIGSRVRVSGTVILEDVEGYISVSVDSIDLIALGFIRFSVENTSEEVNKNTEIGYMFRGDIGGQTGVNLYSKINDVAIEYPFDSAELVENRLRYFHPEMVEAIDVRILNADDEVTALLSLDDMVIPIDVNSEDDDSMIRDMMEYVNHHLEWDTKFPYRVAVNGSVSFENNETEELEHVNLFAPSSEYMYPKRVVFTDFAEAGQVGPNACVPMLYVEIISKETMGESNYAYLPVSSIIDMESMRPKCD